MSHKRKQRIVYQERLASRQAVDRLWRAYAKLYAQPLSDMNCLETAQAKNLSVQEKKQ